MKKFIYILCAVALAGWVVFRFVAIESENSRYVFNSTRVAKEDGAPVEIITVKKEAGILQEPLFIKNNRALVSSTRVAKFRAGQKLGNGVIVSVSNKIDLDSGMYVIRTRGALDGLVYAQAVGVGYFVPVYAMNNGTVMVAENGIATRRNVVVANQDSDKALISQGLSDGDKVVLSKIAEGAKIQIKK